MYRGAPVFWLVLWTQVAGALAEVEQPVEGFARLVSASNQGEYESRLDIVLAQTFPVTGVVTDPQDNPLSGVWLKALWHP